MSRLNRAAEERVARRLQSYPRKRAIAACQLCRTRRTKCDNLRPSCSACLKLGVECTTAATDYSSFDPASLQILDRIGTLEALVRALSGNKTEEPSRGEEAQVTTPSCELGIQICNHLPLPVESLLNLPIFNDRLRSPSGQDRIVTAQSASRESSLQISPHLQNAATLVEEPQEMNKLVECYFKYVHVKNPILPERYVRQAVSSVALNGIDWSPQSCLALLICALGSLSGPFGPDSPLPSTPAYSRSHAYFAAAERRLGPLLLSEDIISAQCLFLAGVYEMTIFRPRQASRLFLQALLTSEQLLIDSGAEDTGLLLSEDSLQALPMRQAIYWSSWKSVTELYAALGYSGLKLEVTGQSPYPSFYPTPPSPENPDGSLSEAEKGRQMPWYFYLAEISLKRLTARLCMEMDALREQLLSDVELIRSWVAQVPLWENEIHEWINSLPAALSFSSPPAEDDICRFVLRGHVLNAFETIYWPFTSLPFSNTFACISGMGPDVLQLLQKGMAIHNDQIHMNQPGFRHRHHGTFFMVRAITRSSLALVTYAFLRADAAHLSDYSSIQMPPQWLEGVQSVLHILRYWAIENPALVEHHKVLETAIVAIDVNI
ncbi:hypothetical protein TruAng_006647 [Truncatella angustata]|nr:hypothetical protein TruAng_006647 [Truncatella angustata]